jgi:hypothetical protein
MNTLQSHISKHHRSPAPWKAPIGEKKVDCEEHRNGGPGGMTRGILTSSPGLVRIPN